MEIKETQPLATVPTEDDTIEVIPAFTLLYPEQASHLDRA